MIIIKKTVLTCQGEKEAELMEHEHNGNIYFRQYFETAFFKPLTFESIGELLSYLDSKNDCPDMPYYVCGNDIYYQLSIGDRTLEYFGTIKGEF